MQNLRLRLRAWLAPRKGEGLLAPALVAPSASHLRALRQLDRVISRAVRHERASLAPDVERCRRLVLAARGAGAELALDEWMESVRGHTGAGHASSVDVRRLCDLLEARVGQRGRAFRIIKFRSMRVDAATNGRPQWAVRNDPRVTRVGRFIRATRLDELPQLINVLRGDLDIMGPRPERPEFVEELKRSIPYYALWHTVKPGLTGWVQVMFPYSGTIEESKQKLQYDLFYIKNMSVKLDIFILVRTVKIVLLGRGSL